jgi:predicted transcriptional regulator
MEKSLVEYVRGRLEAERGNWAEIVAQTKVPYFTIANLVQGKVKDPRMSTVQPLLDYFRRAEAVVESASAANAAGVR